MKRKVKDIINTKEDVAKDGKEKVEERKSKRKVIEKETNGNGKPESAKKPEKPPSTKKEPLAAKSLLNKDSVFETITDSTTDFEGIFDALAEEIINNSVLMVCDSPLRFREIEFYVNHPNHPDKYTHSDVDQRRASCWYFHKIGKTYRGGTYKGLDISIGGKNHFGGILIRSLLDQSTGDIIEGSCLCVNHMIKLVKAKYPEIDSIQGIVSHPKYNEKVLDTTGIIHIEKPDAKEVKYKYYKGTRVGLSQKYPEYLNKLYRYIVLPAKVKKGKDTLVKALLEQGISKREVQSLTGATLALIDKVAAS